jgi:hypothetical protein
MDLTDAELDAIFDAVDEAADNYRHYPEMEPEGFSEAYTKVRNEMVKRKMLPA